MNCQYFILAIIDTDIVFQVYVCVCGLVHSALVTIIFHLLDEHTERENLKRFLKVVCVHFGAILLKTERTVAQS